MRVNVLTPGFTTSNGSAFLFPLVVHKNALRDVAIDVRLVRRSAAGLTDCDILAIDSKEFRNDWAHQRSRTLELISSYRNAGANVLWFDTTDSTGTLQAPVFAVVDRYLKSQLLANKSGYTRRIYGGRVHSEYYYQAAGIADDDGGAVDEPIAPEDLSKLGASWNSGLADYSTYGPARIGLYRRFRFAPLLRYPAALESPGSGRTNDLSARFGANYSKATVRYQREKIRELLSDRLDTQKLSRRGYMQELRRSKVVLSPFGWGEITLKDFEVFLTGGMLLKPSMDHMQTWPNFYESGISYLSHDWNLADLEERIDWAIDNVADRLAIAEEGQRRYIEHTSGPDAAENFATHLSDVLST
ncbi:MAG: hypothetical protein O6922_08895 [Chloroflexi bacterium]|nr:hypothetical protein [Chloroflexota bacterium]